MHMLNVRNDSGKGNFKYIFKLKKKKIYVFSLAYPLECEPYKYGPYCAFDAPLLFVS